MTRLSVLMIVAVAVGVDFVRRVRRVRRRLA
jgi:hypothetical protein